MALLAEGVATTARRPHVSERHLRNLVVDGVGLSPQHVARINWVRTVLAHARARLASDAGYYNQST